MNSTDQRLASELLEQPQDTLWLADENALTFINSHQQVPATLTNRWDIYDSAQRKGAQCWFTDWDLNAALSQHNFSRIVYRVSKERPVVHHLLNQLAKQPQRWQSLTLLGQKNEGIKSYADGAAKLFGNKAINKHGNDYVARFQAPPQPSENTLNDQRYGQLRTIAEWHTTPIQSKPGTFGWQKIDEGSRFLVEQLPSVLQGLSRPPARVLDLGCGYGFLSLAGHELLPDAAWFATDNCAAALTAFEANCGAWATSFAGDRGLDGDANPLSLPVDLLLCNPPFHQGFSTSGDLTEKFVRAMHQWLTPSGLALVVVNQFVGLEKRAQGLLKATQVADNGSFRVLALRR